MKYLVINTDTEEIITGASTELEALEISSEINASNEQNPDGSLKTAYICLA